MRERDSGDRVMDGQEKGGGDCFEEVLLESAHGIARRDTLDVSHGLRRSITLFELDWATRDGARTRLRMGSAQIRLPLSRYLH